MSRGAGKIERAIEQILDESPDEAFTTSELCERIYGASEKRHRVAVGRSVLAVLLRRPSLCEWRIRARGREFVYANSRSSASLEDARKKALKETHSSRRSAIVGVENV